jgi:hypothetical protein
MPGTDVNQLMTVASLKPSGTIDGNTLTTNPRAGRYREPYGMNVIPTKHVLADEGSYFSANNGQTGQVTATAAPTAFTATTPAFIVFNSAAPGNPLSPKIYLDYVLWVVSTPGGTITSVQAAVVRDNLNRFSALGTGGVLLTPVKANSAGPSAVAQVWSGGQLVATAASSNAVFTVGNRVLRGTIPIAFDTYLLSFGSVDDVATTVATAAVASHVLEPVPPMVLNPGESALIYLWYPGMATTGTTLLPEIGWWER